MQNMLCPTRSMISYAIPHLTIFLGGLRNIVKLRQLCAI